MSKIVAIDYGLKRIGIAISDELRVFAFGLTTVSNSEIIPFLKKTINKEQVDTIVIGKPLQSNNRPSEIEDQILLFIKNLNKIFPKIIITRYDERFTSLLAKQTINNSGITKKKRKNKSLVDKISATIILQSYLEKK
jgi:putative Holliday junction resolvase|tara:strand:+ start:9067 stop:9477 length:411 start_codon:yes stop_codon:yes gene_type:complete